ncbi:hypothetical protein PRIPAC_94497 [Pristionchus pacificus]|uniref:Uncharacterized protein n=1 Tax=Pristionchus pacificus TaxID=54126 RepID=A0A2A6CCZ3_PRIPA|nr:hypothetical protein PRIPAC_94497 [Pristionchus pacificus]|eukprot:PDM76064.1 hypothetical protein PRIPAC_39668 [Pristionchus pacificus]
MPSTKMPNPFTATPLDRAHHACPSWNGVVTVVRDNQYPSYRTSWMTAHTMRTTMKMGIWSTGRLTPGTIGTRPEQGYGNRVMVSIEHLKRFLEPF